MRRKSPTEAIPIDKRRLRAVLRVMAATVAGFFLVVAGEVLLAIPGPDDHFQNPSPQPVRFGPLGKPMVYVVMGDSTAAGRGGHYAQGIAMQTARHLAHIRPVVLVNLAVSGAKVDDVAQAQLPAALRLKPDLVLLVVGANDVTHLTPSGKIQAGMTKIMQQLNSVRPGVRIVLTGSPDVGTVRRFAQPLRWLAGTQTSHVNHVFDAVIADASRRQQRIVFAPLARQTGPLFQKDASLFAPDRFHPDDRGYATWIPVLNAALDQALL